MSSVLDTPEDKLQKYTLNPSFQSGLLYIDSEGTIIYASSSILQVLGLPSREVLGNSLFAVSEAVPEEGINKTLGISQSYIPIRSLPEHSKRPG